MEPGRAVALIIVAGTAARLLIGALTGLSIDEAYTVGNARELALSYFDHPPVHLWLTWLAAKVFSSEAPLIVRLPFIALFAGSTWLMYRLTSRLFGSRAGVWAALALNLAPVFGLGFASWVLPDGPALFFLLASATVVARILFAGEPAGRPTALWVAAGALGGAALLSKYNSVFLFAGVFAFLLTVPARRGVLATPGPWFGAIAALIVLTPAIAWNLQHQMVGFAFQAGRANGGSFNPVGFAASIGGQLAYLTPWVAGPLAVALTKALRRGRADQRGWFLALVAIGPIAVFTLLTLRSPGLPHWQMPGWLFAFPLLGREAEGWAGRWPRAVPRYAAASAVVLAVILAAATWQTNRGGLVPQSVIAGRPQLDPTIAVIDWRVLPVALGERGLLAPDLVVGGPTWIIAGKVSYAVGPNVPGLCICTDPRQFAFRGDQRRFNGRDVVVVVPSNQADLWDDVSRYFDRLDPLPTVTVDRAGVPVLTLDLRVGRNLHFPADALH